jgi:hypothetical protein
MVPRSSTTSLKSSQKRRQSGDFITHKFRISALARALHHSDAPYRGNFQKQFVTKRTPLHPSTTAMARNRTQERSGVEASRASTPVLLRRSSTLRPCQRRAEDSVLTVRLISLVRFYLRSIASGRGVEGPDTEKSSSVWFAQSVKWGFAERKCLIGGDKA